MEWHRDVLLANTAANQPVIGKSLRAIKADKKPALIVCAGPSLYRRDPLKYLEQPQYRDSLMLVVTDGAFIRCLRRGITPDYVLTLDPHPTRIVRWFGDPLIDEHMAADDYFARQDLDIDFRKEMRQLNTYNIELVDKHPVPLVICCASPANVIERTAGWDRYWFAPLVDNPDGYPSLTYELCKLSGLPAMNTGGTVGNSAWVFAHAYLHSKDIACVGMDFGYPPGTPLQRTQSWNMLKDKDGIQDYYPEATGVDGMRWFQDPTYHWYKQNLLDLLAANEATLTNCTEGGTLMGDGIRCMDLEAWLKSYS